MAFVYEQVMGKPYPLGISDTTDGMNIALNISCRRECGIVISYKNKNSIKIPFSEKCKIGNLYMILLKGLHLEEFTYQIYADDKLVGDPYAKQLNDHKRWGVYQKGQTQVSYKYSGAEFDWEDDSYPQIPYCDSIFYGLHVRGFTKHTSSKVNAKGTFAGVIEKIPYLKSLGITAAVCMPFYEFDEIIVNKEFQEVKDDIKPFLDKDKETWQYKVNYWGFTDAHYFAPKAAYSYSADAVSECKQMVRELHKNGIECIMRIYFDVKVPHAFIYEVLKYWVTEFHIDGFQLLGINLPMEFLSKDALLGRTKIMCESIPVESIYPENEKISHYKNLAFMNDEFLIAARRFLKSDEDMLYTMAMQIRKNPADVAAVNYITNYQGFTLMDLVSYDRKHNEANGEENRDGTEYNFSWNCGVEGRTKKKNIVKLRMSQIKNALAMVLLSQSVPMIQAGDEFGFSSGGNNNPYCQDNAVTWLNWNLIKMNEEILSFTKRLIQLRKMHPILHKEEAFRIMDYISCGYPDLSYHGEEAWRQQFENYNRHMSILYCGKYAKLDRKKEDDFIYMAYNMHWEEHELALPKLPPEMKWYCALSTQETEPADLSKLVPLDSQEILVVEPRTIKMIIGK